MEPKSESVVTRHTRSTPHHASRVQFHKLLVSENDRHNNAKRDEREAGRETLHRLPSTNGFDNKCDSVTHCLRHWC